MQGYFAGEKRTWTRVYSKPILLRNYFKMKFLRSPDKPNKDRETLALQKVSFWRMQVFILSQLDINPVSSDYR